MHIISKVKPLGLRAEISSRTVTKEFRELLLEQYPRLKETPQYWYLLSYLFYPREVDSGNILISRDIMVDLLGYSSVPSNFNTEAILLDFSETIQPIWWTKYIKTKHQARTLAKIAFPTEVSMAFTKELMNSWNRENRVYLISGKSFSEERQMRNIYTQLKSALKQTHKIKETKTLLDYMNRIPVLLFKKIVIKNYDGALNTALKLNSDSEHQLKILSSILDNPVQLYKPGENTVRIFPIGEKIVSLKSEVRKELTKGLSEADLKSAQLAIAAYLWKIESVDKFLREGNSIWEYLYQLGTHDKDSLKDILYSLLFGMHHAGIKKQLEKINVRYKDFIELPLVKDIFTARNNEIKRINKEGGTKTCFGDYLSTSKFEVKSILAQCCQSIELKILYPAVKIAMEHNNKNGFRILLWQHDGFTLYPRVSAKKEFWKEVLSFHVDSEAERLGIATKLQWADL